MTIEKRIKQKKFKSNAEKAIVNIAYTQSYFSSKINSVLKARNISSQQFNVLRIIKGQHPSPVSVGDITSRMIDKMSNTSRLIRRLEKKDLVQRVNNPFDGRQINVFLTLRGAQILEKSNVLVNTVVHDHGHLSEEELIELNRLLDKIRIE
ncbi:MAG: MarR family transcriptional regulator [Flavobacteriaceae bacterium]|nr:MarR family transcriptional regulator [Flavobacteriaceae bacterium]